jgi:hypothetical protein
LARKPGAARSGGPCRAVAGLRLEPECGSRLGTTPIGGPCLSARVKGRREKGREGGLTGPGERRRKQLPSWAAREGKKREEKPVGLGLREKKERGEKEERMGRAQREKEREKELHSNAFEFEFEI